MFIDFFKNLFSARIFSKVYAEPAPRESAQGCAGRTMELTDCQLSIVRGGMSPETFNHWRDEVLKCYS